MDYYKILGLKSTCTKKDIKKKYRELSLKYHPDKNNGDDAQFKIINEAYETLYDDKKREKYDIEKYFKHIDFTEEDYELLKIYYHKLINSNEFRLMKLLYDSIPENIKNDLWNRFKKSSSKCIIKSEKTIDVTKLYQNIVINLLLKKQDYDNKTLKIIHIITNEGIYYLYLRGNINSIHIKNDEYFLDIHFYIRNNI
jgi:curved DNA-binding protein CbpA